MPVLTGDLSGMSEIPSTVVATSSTQYFPVIVGLLASTVTLLITIAAITYGRDFLHWIACKLVGVGGEGDSLAPHELIMDEFAENGVHDAEISEELLHEGFDIDMATNYSNKIRGTSEYRTALAYIHHGRN